MAGLQGLSPGNLRLQSQFGPHACRLRGRRVGRGLLHADRQVFQHHRPSAGHPSAPAAEHSPGDGDLLSRRPAKRRRWVGNFRAGALCPQSNKAPAGQFGRVGPLSLGHALKRRQPRLRHFHFFPAPAALRQGSRCRLHRGGEGQRAGDLALHRLPHGHSGVDSLQGRHRGGRHLPHRLPLRTPAGCRLRDHGEFTDRGGAGGGGNTRREGGAEGRGPSLPPVPRAVGQPACGCL